MPFKTLGLKPDLVDSIKELGYVEPTPIQTAAIPHVLEGRDLIGCAQTGTGKTAAFILPTLQRISDKPGIKALVVTPTRELAHQIEEMAEVCASHTGQKTAVVYGGVPYAAQENKIRAGIDLLVATPGRLLDLKNRRVVDLRHIEILILDEADRMLDMGFWPDVEKIIRALPHNRQSLLFSATMSDRVVDVIRHTLDDPITIEAGPKAVPVEAIEQIVYPVDAMQKEELLVELLKHSGMERVLVFSNTKRRADFIDKVLTRHGVKIAPIHSDLTQSLRAQTINGFKTGAYQVLVATDIVARGIDIEGVSHVINFDMPTNPEDYVHRIGRTARAGEDGTAISLISTQDIPDLRAVEAFIGKRIPTMDLEGFDYHDRVVPSATAPPPNVKRRLAFDGGAKRSFARRGRRR